MTNAKPVKLCDGCPCTELTGPDKQLVQVTQTVRPYTRHFNGKRTLNLCPDCKIEYEALTR